MENADEVECGACTGTVTKLSAVAAGWKLVRDTHYDVAMGQAILVHEWQCGSCAPGAHSENAGTYGTSGGVELTNEVIERVAEEAEQGYPTDRLRRREEERFNQVADALIRRVMPEIPEEYREGFESMMIGGEYSMAIGDLVVILADLRIRLNSADAEVLRVLVSEIHG